MLSLVAVCLLPGHRVAVFLLCVDLLRRVRFLEHGHLFQLGSDASDDREVRHVHIEAVRIVHLRYEVHVGQRDAVADAEFARSQCELFFETQKAATDPKMSPFDLRLALLFRCQRFGDLRHDGEVLDRLDIAADDAAQIAHLRPLQAIFRKQWFLGSCFFQVFQNRTGLAQQVAIDR